jgi:hypothetical protein
VRFNSEGIPRDQLGWALAQPKFVLNARKINACLLCRRNHVNEAGLCEVCWALLSDEELALATRWTSGAMPE